MATVASNKIILKETEILRRISLKVGMKMTKLTTAARVI